MTGSMEPRSLFTKRGFRPRGTRSCQQGFTRGVRGGGICLLFVAVPACKQHAAKRGFTELLQWQASGTQIGRHTRRGANITQQSPIRNPAARTKAVATV
ncbi:MAG: hypothetical protein FD161_4914 [Limisphaerales bacterium]|nr:MAG: hypothetical protein FD161_4914 [Limisphaerales bacterium]